MAMQNVAVLGATGSIGRSALDVIARHPERFRAVALAAGRGVDALVAAAAALAEPPRWIAVADAALLPGLRRKLAEARVRCEHVLAGPDAAAEIAALPEVDAVVQGIVGAAAVASSFAAAGAGKRLLLANKESVVCGGELLMDAARDAGGLILPVDSEHNAVFQCLAGASDADRAGCRIWLTCSGGPFAFRPEVDLAAVRPEDALRHPTWSMGSKITIDSATLMNKGLEVIEASHLFGVPAERISVALHPQSVIHSMVEMSDGSVIAQLASTDMRMPIACCLGWPERIASGAPRLGLPALANLTFAAPDTERFPQLAYAYEAAGRGRAACIALNAANEVGVAAFLARRIGFTDIARVCRAGMDACAGAEPQSLEEILAQDAEARARAEGFIAAGL